jgi:hypothetical protein
MNEEQAIDLAQKKNNLALQIRTWREELAAVQRELKIRRRTMMDEITQLKGADGKPLHSNADKREAALDAREREDPATFDMLGDIDRLTREIELASIDHAYQSDLLAIALAFAGE